MIKLLEFDDGTLASKIDLRPDPKAEGKAPKVEVEFLGAGILDRNDLTDGAWVKDSVFLPSLSLSSSSSLSSKLLGFMAGSFT